MQKGPSFQPRDLKARGRGTFQNRERNVYIDTAVRQWYMGMASGMKMGRCIRSIFSTVAEPSERPEGEREKERSTRSRWVLEDEQKDFKSSTDAPRKTVLAAGA